MFKDIIFLKQEFSKNIHYEPITTVELDEINYLLKLMSYTKRKQNKKQNKKTTKQTSIIFLSIRYSFNEAGFKL